MSKVVKT